MKLVINIIFQWIYYIELSLAIFTRNLENKNGGLTTVMSGKGYIHNAFPKASISWSTEVLIIEFKTKESDLVLFYSGDMNELIPVATFRSTLIYIDKVGQLAYNFTRTDDKIKKIIDIKLKNKYGGIFNDNQWHKLKFIRTLNKGNNGYELKILIEEDDISIYKNSFSTLSLFIKTRFLSIGGMSDFSFKKRNFMGCLFKVIYKADNILLDVLDFTQKKLHGFSEIGQPISFSKGCQQIVDDFTSISFLSPKSFVVLKTKYQQYQYYDLQIQFIPQIISFLLYFHRSITNDNFISLEVRDRQLVIGIGYLNKITIWYPEDSIIEIGKSSNIYLYVDYLNGKAKFKFNNEISAEKQILIGASDFSNDLSVFFNSEIILGDQFTLNSVKYFPPEVWMASLRKGFQGCLEKVILNDEIFDLKRSLKSTKSKTKHLATKGCVSGQKRQLYCVTSKSKNSPCKNEGLCEGLWPDITCNCDFTNYQGAICNEAIQPINFDGSEFVRLDLGTEFYTEVESILIRFKTTYQFAFLFSINPSDSSELNSSSMQLSIEYGLPIFVFQPRNEKQIFKLSTNVSNGKWHSLIINRNFRTLTLNLDGKILQQAILSNETIISWQQINIAASLKSDDWNYNQPFSPEIWLIKSNSDNIRELKSNFVGEINKFIINGIDIINEFFLFHHLSNNRQWKMQAQANSLFVNKVLNKLTKNLVYPITFFTPDSYLIVSKLYLYDSFSLSFYLKTNQKNGIILMISGTSNDFFLLELIQGYIKLSFNMGSTVQSLSDNCDGSCNLANNKWHHLEISRIDLSRNVISLLIDERIVEEVTIHNSHKAKNFNFDKPAFLGGMPRHQYVKWKDYINTNYGFQGCIAGFSVNGKKPIHLLQNSLVEIPVDFKSHIKHNCQSNMTICKDNYCKNGGQCLQQFEKASCDCSYTTFDGEFCTQVSATINFRRQVASNNYIQFKFQDRTRNTSRDDIAFGLQTKKLEGTIIFIESKRKDKGDFMHLYLENGKIVLEYDMGAGIRKLTDHSINVSDGYYRRVRVRRLGASAWLQIDNTRSELEPTVINLGRSFNEQHVIWIGAVPNRKDAKQFEGSLSGLILNGILSAYVLENKKDFPYLQIVTVGDVIINSSAKINLQTNSVFEITDYGKTYHILDSSVSSKNPCKDLKSNQCFSTKRNYQNYSKSKVTTRTPFYQFSDIPILPTITDSNNSSLSNTLSKRSLIIIFTCFSIVFVVVSFCIICRCCRKRGDRGSYNLTKADKYEQRLTMFDTRPDLQSSASVQSVSPEKEMIELSPFAKNPKVIDSSPCRIGNGMIMSSGGSTQTIATYIPKNKDQTHKKKEIKEWYV